MSLRSAILGFLSLEPTSGYTLKRRVDGSVGSFWSATQSQIYRELHALEDAGLVRVETMSQQGKPDRKIYALTAAGRTALAKWLEEPLEPLTLRHPLLLKLVFAADVAPDKLDAVLARYAEGIEATRREYEARMHDPQIMSLARSAREGLLWRQSIAHGLAWCRTEADWITETRRVLASSPNQGATAWTSKTKSSSSPARRAASASPAPKRSRTRAPKSR